MRQQQQPSATHPKSQWRDYVPFIKPKAQERKAAVPAFYSSLQAYVHQTGRAVWSSRHYTQFAEEAYRRNVIANRAIAMIASGVASVSVLAYDADGQEIFSHPVLSLFNRPNPQQSRHSFLEAFASYYLLAGNAFVQAVGGKGEPPRELHLLRPDRVQVVAGRYGVPQAYRYVVDAQEITFPVDSLTGMSRLLHLKHFNPLNDWQGLAPIEAAAYSIDQHNQAAAWNQALLQNGARPSGALVLKTTEHGGRLTEEQYTRLKQQVDDQFSGAANAGRPLLLEGGLEWKEMSLSPRDMDFLNIKHSSARDIALAFGVPPQLLGIPGDNTYANLAEARLSLWEQTILPLLHRILEEMTHWLNPMFGTNLLFKPDLDSISALAPKRDYLWKQIAAADFLTQEEKREMLGFSPVADTIN